MNHEQAKNYPNILQQHSSPTRTPVSQSGLPATVAAAVNRRAFALAQQMYPAIQNDLQALAWDLIEQDQAPAQVVAAIERLQRSSFAFRAS